MRLKARKMNEKKLSMELKDHLHFEDKEGDGKKLIELIQSCEFYVPDHEKDVQIRIIQLDFAGIEGSDTKTNILTKIEETISGLEADLDENPVLLRKIREYIAKREADKTNSDETTGKDSSNFRNELEEEYEAKKAILIAEEGRYAVEGTLENDELEDIALLDKPLNSDDEFALEEIIRALQSLSDYITTKK